MSSSIESLVDMARELAEKAVLVGGHNRIAMTDDVLAFRHALTATLAEKDVRIAELEGLTRQLEMMRQSKNSEIQKLLAERDVPQDDDLRFVDEAAIKFLAAEITHTGMRELLEGDVAMAVDNAEALLVEKKRREHR